MNNQDYIPQTDGKFLEWVKFLFTYVEAHATAFGLDPRGFDDINALISAYEQAYETAEDPNRGKADVLAKNETRDDLKKATRKYVKEFLEYNSHVTDDDRKRMGLPIHKTTRTPAPVATTYPDFDIDSSIIRCLIIHFFNQGGKKSKAKPAGQHGAQIRWAVSDTPIVDVSELTRSSIDTHTPFTLEFEGHERGKTVYFCLCWENTRGERGPWSEIMSAIIP